jgi:hypothetical protein
MKFRKENVHLSRFRRYIVIYVNHSVAACIDLYTIQVGHLTESTMQRAQVVILPHLSAHC